MRIAAIQLFLFFLSSLQPVQAQDLIYAKGLSNSVPLGGNIENRAVAVDAAGNKYVLGRFQLTADFDLGAGVQDLTSAGDYDIYLAKYDAANNYVWAKRIGGTSTDQGYALAVDPSGNCYITGSFSGTADFDPNTGTQNLTSAGSYDLFVAKYDASGNYVWAKNIGGTSDDYGLGLAIDATGNCYFTGYFQGANIDFDADATGSQTLSSNGASIDIFLAKYDAAGNYVWAKRMGGTSTDQGYALAADAAGNIYITGHFQGTNVDFDPNAGTQNLSSAGVSDVFLAKYDASGNYVWAKKMGGTSSEIGYAIAIDASGNSYITGQFEGSNADFDPDATNTQNLVSIGSVDLFFAKYDALGNYVWAKSIGGYWNDYGRAIAVDGLGNCYLTGDFRGSSTDFDTGTGSQYLTGASSYTNDIFIAKYDASGAYVWAKSVGTDSGTDGGYGLTVDAAGNSYSTGSFVGTVDFDPGAGTVSLNGSTSTNNGYILQLNSAGNYVSAMAGGLYSPNALGDYGTAIKVDASGNSYVLGTFMGTVDFDAGAAVQDLVSAGYEDIFLAKYDASGNFVWAKRIGGTNTESGQALALDASGNIYITGFFIGTTDFDPGSGVQNLTSTAGNIDLFLAKYDASGNYVWAKRMGGSGSETGNGLAIDASGNCYVTGSFSGTADFDPAAATTQNLVSTGNQDVFLAKYDASGNYIWAKGMGSVDVDAGNGVAVDASGNSYITGLFWGTADFDPGPAVQNLLHAGAGDIFLAKYDASGNYIWAKRIGGSGTDNGRNVVVDASGNVCITGSFQGANVNFDPNGGLQYLNDAGSGDIFMAKYDASGNYVWAKNMGGTAVDYCRGLAIDAANNIYVTGGFNGTADFDPGTGTYNLTPAGSTDIYLAKYDASGNFIWVKSMGGTNSDVASALAVDASGNTYITGYFTETADLDPGSGTQNLVSLNGNNIFIAKYSPATTLPIRLENFSGQLINNDAAVLLQWTTAAEENFAYFEIERSADGKHLTTLGRVTGCGTCNGRQKYSLTDDQPLTGKGYYRLKLVDIDGRAEYSKWIYVYKNESGQSFVIYPTVTSGSVDASYKLSGTGRKIRISLFDAHGRLIQQNQATLASGSNQLHVDLSSQAQGLYYVQLAEQNGKVLATGTVIRQ